MKDFKLPDLGEGVHEGQVLRVMVAAGDSVREDQPLMEVETDKAAVVIPCPYTGTVKKVHVEPGQLVHVGEVMVTINDTTAKASASERGPATSVARVNASSTKPQAMSRVAVRRNPASPAVRKLARSHSIDIESIRGSGPGGRVQRADVERAAMDLSGSALTTPAEVAKPQKRTSSLADAVKLKGSEQTARGTVAARISHPPLPESLIVEPKGESAADQYGPIVRAPLSLARKTIANVMAESWSTIPHATDFDDADVTELDKIRRGYQHPENPQAKLTMLAFVIRAVVRALQKFPEFNASIDLDNGHVMYKRYINIAVGVHTERGLVPMVIRDADRMSIPQISEELAVLGEKARSATFAVNDTRGGTYTISNAGAMGGSRFSTPIITPPQVAVLAVGKTNWMPWVIEQENGARGLAPRLIMPLSHSIDHRLLDGGQEVQFLQHVIGDLQNPARLLL